MARHTGFLRLVLISTVAVSAVVTGADTASTTRTSLLDARIATDGAKRAGDAHLRLHKATDAYLALGATASAADRSSRQKAAHAAYRDYEAAIPGAKADVAALVTALKKTGGFQKLDARLYADPAAFGTTPGELRALKAAGGPQAVLAGVSRHFEEDLADYRMKLGMARTAWQFNLSPLPEAEAGFFCSLAAWSVKTATCWWDQPCYDHWASANRNNCYR